MFRYCCAKTVCASTVSNSTAKVQQFAGALSVCVRLRPDLSVLWGIPPMAEPAGRMRKVGMVTW